MLNDIQFIEQTLINSLYYLRSLREYCIRIQVSFPNIYESYIKRSEELGKRCEELGERTLNYADGNINPLILNAGVFVTKYTLECEFLTEKLFGVDINTDLTKRELAIKPRTEIKNDKTTEEIAAELTLLNEEQISLTNDFLEFANDIYEKINNQELFAFYYNSLNIYIIEETNLYIQNLERLRNRNSINPSYVAGNEFWVNTFLYGIASFIRGEIDPYYEDIFTEANNFVTEYKNIIAEYENMIITPETQQNMTRNSLELAIRLKNFLERIIEMTLKKELYFIAAPITKDNALTTINYFIYNLRSTEYLVEEDIKK